MGRNRTYDEADVVARAAASFRSTGYEGTGVDELLRAVGLHRGSLYQAFGSKRGLFVAALRHALAAEDLGADELDLALVALLELAPRDREVRSLLDARLAALPGAAARLGERLLHRAGLPANRTATETADPGHTTDRTVDPTTGHAADHPTHTTARSAR